MTPDQKPSRVFTEAPQPIIACEARKDGILRFTPEQKSVLENEGYTVYILTGMSVEEMAKMYGPFDSSSDPTGDWHYMLSSEARSRKSEVAIDRDNFPFPDSGRYDIDAQERMVNSKIRPPCQGVKVVAIGEAPDYLELRALGVKWDGPTYIRTKTKGKQFYIADTQENGIIVGGELGILRSYLGPRRGVYAGPFIVPEGNK